ncbi:alpha-ketoglutarate-dependent dioxygenase FTO isoform X7 [Mustelus asterias]
MKRFGQYDKAKESKKQKLLKEIEDRKLPYLTPKDVQFEQLSKAKYPKLYLRQASCVPQEIHQKVQQGLTMLQDYLGPAADESNITSIKGRDPALWHVGLKVAWDIATPGLAFPLRPGDCYFMLDDLNTTHQHCVLSGMQPRFSSTHRVAECSSGTLDYIFRRCDVAMRNLRKDPLLGIPSLISLEPTYVRQTEEIHNEVEFEWLRQFWFQGKRSAKASDWWFGPMAVLENSWRKMEQMTKLLLCEIDEAEWSSERKHQVVSCLLPFLEERQELRKSWMTRCQSRLANSLPVDEQPECRPHWCSGDPDMPLPFDLEEIISLLRNQLVSADGDIRS